MEICNFCDSTSRQRELMPLASAFRTVGIANIDDFFADAATIVTHLADLHESIISTKRKVQERTCSRNAHLNSVFAMLYAYSAGGDGNLDQIGFELYEELFIIVNWRSLSSEHQSIAHAWNDFVRNLVDAKPKLADLEGQLQALSQSAPALINTEINAQNPPPDLSQAHTQTRQIDVNLQHLKTIRRYASEFINWQAELALVVSEQLNEDGEMNIIRTIGRQACDAGAIEPSRFIERYWSRRL